MTTDPDPDPDPDSGADAEAPARAATSPNESPSAGPTASPPPMKARRVAERADRSKLRADDGRLVRGRRSRERIRNAATDLFRERGFDGATLREIARRAGMGASSIYRHVRSKEELLVDELAKLQEDAWLQFRKQDDRKRPTRERVQRFLEIQHQLLVADRDFTTIAMRAITKPETRVARDVLQLHDRTVGLLMEVLQMGRMRKDLARGVDVMEAARVVFHVTQGVRISWAHGLLSDEACLDSIERGVDLVFSGLAATEAKMQHAAASPREGERASATQSADAPAARPPRTPSVD
jgi:AcrR family transcriptional regulator